MRFDYVKSQLVENEHLTVEQAAALTLPETIEALTRDGEANVSKNIDFLRYRIGIPMIQVETLGAGGGSISVRRRSRSPKSCISAGRPRRAASRSRPWRRG